jgi:hypothetical protein
MALCHFHGTLKCVVLQFVCGAPLACSDDHCRAQVYIGAVILALFILVFISKHLRVFVKVLLEVQNYASYMKTKKTKNLLDLDCVQMHTFLALHLKLEVHKIQQS